MVVLVSKFSCNSQILPSKFSSNFPIFSEKESKVLEYSWSFLSSFISLFLKSLLKISDNCFDSATRFSIFIIFSDRILSTEVSLSLTCSLIEVRPISTTVIFSSRVTMSFANALNNLFIPFSVFALDSSIPFIFSSTASIPFLQSFLVDFNLPSTNSSLSLSLSSTFNSVSAKNFSYWGNSSSSNVLTFSPIPLTSSLIEERLCSFTPSIPSVIVAISL